MLETSALHAHADEPDARYAGTWRRTLGNRCHGNAGGSDTSPGSIVQVSIGVCVSRSALTPSGGKGAGMSRSPSAQNSGAGLLDADILEQ